MRWRFTLIDRNDVATMIKEPVGWDACEINVTRDANTHGIFFDYQGNDFSFYGSARQIIEDEYENYGVEGNIVMVIEQACENNEYVELYRGRLSFSEYDQTCGGECFVKIPIVMTGDVMMLRNLWDQKVNLETDVAFDEATDLIHYDDLPIIIELPSKGIFLQDNAGMETPETTEINSQTIFWDGPNTVDPRKIAYMWIQIVPQFEKVTFTEIGRFGPPVAPEHTILRSQWYSEGDQPAFETVVNGKFSTPPDTRRIFFAADAATPLLVNEAGDNNFNTVKKFSFEVSYSFDVKIEPTLYVGILMGDPYYATTNIVSLYNVVVIHRKDGTFEYLAKEKIMSGLSGGFQGYDPATIWKNGETHTVNFSRSYTDVVLNDGDYLFVVVCGLATLSQLLIYNYDHVIYSLISKTGSVNISSLSKSDPTPAKVFLVNEALSRVSEAITNNNIKAYSEYFGRIDSQPYAVAEDGCGSLEAITKGLFIRRQENRLPDNPFLFTISMKDMLDGLDPIHHIGFGIEADENRPGFNRLRVEPWKYFYKTDVILECTGVNKIEKSSMEAEHYSTFQFGYNKWEAEEFNGLDEFLTKRNYRTLLTQVKSTFAKFSAFIASGYAWEITRRKSDDSKDWRYDNETFIVCLKRGGFLVAVSDLSTIIYGKPPLYLNAGDVLTFSEDLTGTYTVSTVFSNQPDKVSFIPYPALPVGSYSNVTVSVNGVPFLGSTLSVEQGNVIDAENIIDPPTLYNFRISPIRNAMRWVDKIFSGYRKTFPGNRIIFTDGDGNYHAKGEMESDFCKIENQPLEENVDIDVSLFADVDEATPILRPERISFSYPVSVADFRNIMENQYGLVRYTGCEDGYGWIDTITYKPEMGIANFKLIPKYE